MLRTNSKNFKEDIKKGYVSTVADFIEQVGEQLSKEVTADYEYQVSDEFAAEELSTNDYEFTQEGKIA